MLLKTINASLLVLQIFGFLLLGWTVREWTLDTYIIEVVDPTPVFEVESIERIIPVETPFESA